MRFCTDCEHSHSSDAEQGKCRECKHGAGPTHALYFCRLFDQFSRDMNPRADCAYWEAEGIRCRASKHPEDGGDMFCADVRGFCRQHWSNYMVATATAAPMTERVGIFQQQWRDFHCDDFKERAANAEETAEGIRV